MNLSRARAIAAQTKIENSLKKHVASIASAQEKANALMEMTAKSAGAKFNVEKAKATLQAAKEELAHQQETLTDLEKRVDVAKKRFEELKAELRAEKERCEREAAVTDEVSKCIVLRRGFGVHLSVPATDQGRAPGAARQLG